MRRLGAAMAIALSLSPFMINSGHVEAAQVRLRVAIGSVSYVSYNISGNPGWGCPGVNADGPAEADERHDEQLQAQRHPLSQQPCRHIRDAGVPHQLRHLRHVPVSNGWILQLERLERCR